MDPHPTAESHRTSSDSAAFAVTAGAIAFGLLLLGINLMWGEPKPPPPTPDAAGQSARSGVAGLLRRPDPPRDPAPPPTRVPLPVPAVSSTSGGARLADHLPVLDAGSGAAGRRRYLAQVIRILSIVDLKWHRIEMEARSTPVGPQAAHQIADQHVERFLQEVRELRADPRIQSQGTATSRAFEREEVRPLLEGLDAYETAARHLLAYLESGENAALWEAGRHRRRAVKEREMLEFLLPTQR
jgi:hypothetical protein